MSKFKPGDLALVVGAQPEFQWIVGCVVTLGERDLLLDALFPGDAPHWDIDIPDLDGEPLAQEEKYLIPLNPPPDMLEEERDKELTA